MQPGPTKKLFIQSNQCHIQACVSNEVFAKLDTTKTTTQIVVTTVRSIQNITNVWICLISFSDRIFSPRCFLLVLEFESSPFCLSSTGSSVYRARTRYQIRKWRLISGILESKLGILKIIFGRFCMRMIFLKIVLFYRYIALCS